MYRMVNFQEYRERISAASKREYQKEWVKQKRKKSNNVESLSSLSKQAEAEAEAEAEKTRTPLKPPVEDSVSDFTKTKHSENTAFLEAPPGFPKTEAEAITTAQCAAIPAETAKICYQIAVSRGYRDARGQVIRSFIAHCQAAFQIGITPRKRWQIKESIDSLTNRIDELRRQFGMSEIRPGDWSFSRKLTDEEKNKLRKLKSDREALKNEFDNAME
jgi:hypothetical protein